VNGKEKKRRRRSRRSRRSRRRSRRRKIMIQERERDLERTGEGGGLSYYPLPVIVPTRVEGQQHHEIISSLMSICMKTYEDKLY
jgi:hypothetical protein